MPSHRLPRLVLALLLTGSTALAGCSRDDPPPAPAGTTTAPPGTPPPATAPPATQPTSTTPPATEPISDEAAITQTIDGFWKTWLAANDPPNPDHPDLQRYMTGAALETAVSSIRNARSLSQTRSLPPDSVFSATVTEVVVSGDTATAAVCLVDDGLVVDAPSGKVLNDRVSTSKVNVRLKRTSDGWRVDRNDFVDTHDGVATCQ